MQPRKTLYLDTAPLSDMNTTPLIDVMLVLLIMMILNIPLQTHKTEMQLPLETINSFQPPPHHLLTINFDGAFTWDGKSVSKEALLEAFRQIGVLPQASQAQVRIRPDEYAGYDRVLKVLALAQRQHVENVAFVGTEAFANP